MVLNFKTVIKKSFVPKKIFGCSLILDTSVHENIFHIGPTVLALKLDEGIVLEGRRGNHPHELFFSYFSNKENDIQSKQILVQSKIVQRWKRNSWQYN